MEKEENAQGFLFLTPQKTFSISFKRQVVTRKEIANFKAAFAQMRKQFVIGEGEENYKNLFRDFLQNVHYPETQYCINTSDRCDMVIHENSEASSAIQCIIETKAPGKETEMFSENRQNAKSLCEIILYYLREYTGIYGNKISKDKNLFLKTLVITNFQDFYIFNAKDFLFVYENNASIRRLWQDYNSKNLTGESTKFFYENIAPIFIKCLQKTNTKVTHISLLDIQKAIDKYNENQDYKHEAELVNCYKIFSPFVLIGKPYRDDANTLDWGFYHELLYAMGLEEYYQDGLVLIRYNKKPGSLMNCALHSLENRDMKLDEALDIAMKLVIVWTNRLLFLKLFEGMLLEYEDKKQFRLLSRSNIESFNSLESLFFSVMAKRPFERRQDLQEKYEGVPYMNSSLFEMTQEEREYCRISTLDNNLVLEPMSSSFIQTRGLTTLQYMLTFLDSYNFASEGTKNLIQEERKTLINAAVLGLVFEKINGYQDGSFFTPSFVTQYVAKDIIDKTIVKKFNEEFAWDAKTLEDLRSKIMRQSAWNSKYIEVFNSIKIVDPAVGSGHFLVSALNYMIYAKSYLMLLQYYENDEEKKARYAHDINYSLYQIGIENDELVVTTRDGSPYKYSIHIDDNRHLQEALFEEKSRTIRESLFGADLNANSVAICCLRLWIELLKSAYYTQESDYKDLETLPNIDINIKIGDSLLSEHSVQVGLGAWQEVGQGSLDFSQTQEHIVEYKALLSRYKTQDSKQEKNATRARIQELKASLGIAGDFAGGRGSGMVDWALCFPEVLSDSGVFLGFDIVMGNPPYIQLQRNGGLLADKYAKAKYYTYCRAGDIYCLFYERAFSLVKQGGFVGFITSNKWQRAGYGERLREFLTSKTNPLVLLDFGGQKVFAHATVDTAILIGQKAQNEGKTLCLKAGKYEQNWKVLSAAKKDAISCKFVGNKPWIIMNAIESSIKQKIESAGTPLKEWDIQINYGIKTGYNEAFIIDTKTREEILSNCRDTFERERTACLLKPLLRGRDIKRYGYDYKGLYLIATMPSRHYDIEQYPAVKEYLLRFGKDRLEQAGKTYTDKDGNIYKSRKKTQHKWYELQDIIAYYQDFDKPKIAWASVGDVSYSYIPKGMLLLDTNYFIAYDDVLLLLALFNSKAVCNWIRYMDTPIGSGGAYRHYKYNLEKLCIPNMDDTTKQKLRNLTKEILELQKTNPLADISNLQATLDDTVFDLYKITSEERSYILKSLSQEKDKALASTKP